MKKMDVGDFKQKFMSYPPQNQQQFFSWRLQNRKKHDVPDVCKYCFFLEWCVGWSQVFRFSTVFKLDFSSLRYVDFLKKTRFILPPKVGGVWRGLKSKRCVSFVSERVGSINLGHIEIRNLFFFSCKGRKKNFQNHFFFRKKFC